MLPRSRFPLYGIAIATSLAACEPAVCGNGIVERSEACDDGNPAVDRCEPFVSGCTVCGPGCVLVEGVVPYCGDGILDSDERCDHGGVIEERCPYSVPVCGKCGQGCTIVERYGAYCGDGNIDVDYGETCDDGNPVTEACPYGVPTCAVCDSWCRDMVQVGAYCGDGTVDGGGGEVCDDGDNDDGNGCDSNCTLTACGNGVLTAGETCELGAPCGPGRVCVECGCVDNVCVAPMPGRRVGELDDLLYVHQIIVRDGLAYLSGTMGLWVVDVAVPALPTVLGYGETPISLPDLGTLVVHGNHAYAAPITLGGSSIEVFDVSDASAPRWVTRVPTGDDTRAMAVMGDYLYAGGRIPTAAPPKLHVIDVSAPAEAAEVASLVRATGISAMDAVSGTLYVSGGDLEVYDVATPEAPQLLGAVVGASRTRAIDIESGVAYAASVDEGLVMFDVADPGAPRRIGAYVSQVGLSSDTYHVVVDGDRAFAEINHNLEVIDVSDPASPRHIEVLHNNPGTVLSHDATVDGAFLYLVQNTRMLVFQVCELPP